MSPVTRRRLLLGAAALATGTTRLALAQPMPRDLRVGLVPYLSTRAMVGLYQPLRQHLEAEIKGPVTLFTAADFRALVENARAGEYGLAMLPGHFVRIALEDWGHTLVARNELTTEVQLVGRRGAEPALPGGLRGKRIAAIDPLSLTALTLVQWLAQRGLVVGRDVEIDYVRSAGSAVIAVQRGDAVAMIGAIGQLRDFGIGESSDLVKLATIEAIPAPAFVAHASVAPSEVAAWQRALLSFKPAQGLEGGLSRQRYAAGSLRDFDGVAAYADEARRLLAAPRAAPRSGTRPGT